MGGLIAAMYEQFPELATKYARRLAEPCHFQDHLRKILLDEHKGGSSPLIVVETGVQFGVSSDRILAALDEIGGHGLLYSIDPAPKEGIFELTHPRWVKRRQMSTEALSDIYERTGPWSVFLHDSDHDVWCQTFEYEVAWHFVRDGGLVLSDDSTWGVPPHGAWQRFCRRHDIDYIAERDARGYCAIARKPAAALGQSTTRADDRPWIDKVIADARALADVALAEYVPAGG